MCMEHFKPIFKSKSKRKAAKIYTILSEVIPSRNSRQCRSRYQKMMKRHKNFTKAKKYFVTRCGGEKSYKEGFEKMTKFLADLPQLQSINGTFLDKKKVD